MKNRIILLTAFLLTCSLPLSAQTRIAVLPAADKTGEVTHVVKMILKEQLKATIAGIDGYEALDRFDLSSVLDDQAYQESGKISRAQIRQVGEATGASHVLIMEVAPYNDSYVTAVAQIVDTDQAGIAYMASRLMNVTDSEALEADCKALAYKLLQISGPQSSGFRYVDLGLSVKWATCNLGATSPEDYGDYYAWAETETKTDYGWSTYRWCKGSTDSITKYNTKALYGTADNLTRMDSWDDVAHMKLGGKWRMPTDAEWTELRTKCTWIWATLNGVKGYNVAGPSGNSIFLPAAGSRGDSSLDNADSFGFYWSSSLNADYPSGAWGISFDSMDIDRDNGSRGYGQSIRPVTE